MVIVDGLLLKDNVAEIFQKNRIKNSLFKTLHKKLLANARILRLILS